MMFFKKILNRNFEKNLQNPYVLGSEGRTEWNDRYMNMAKAMRNWQLAFCVVALIVMIQTLVIGKLASQSNIQPFVVETNRGVPYAMKPMTGVSNTDQRIINYAINLFIINAKTIIRDSKAQELMLDRLYAYSAEQTIPFLTHYYEKNNPYRLSAAYTISIDIINSMPIGDQLWQVIWDETKRNHAGEVIDVRRWMAQVSYKMGNVKEKKYSS